MRPEPIPFSVPRDKDRAPFQVGGSFMAVVQAGQHVLQCLVRTGVCKGTNHFWTIFQKIDVGCNSEPSVASQILVAVGPNRMGSDEWLTNAGASCNVFPLCLLYHQMKTGPGPPFGGARLRLSKR